MGLQKSPWLCVGCEIFPNLEVVYGSAVNEHQICAIAKRGRPGEILLARFEITYGNNMSASVRSFLAMCALITCLPGTPVCPTTIRICHSN